ncbi:hypothetical protein [Sphingomonas sanxanigenens]|uniref:hypothetical protein n=1 Tax=Sphingomonas sanxanigenens TaxID=397260 RepID=UPI001300E9AD|nr:hypothetical protein [Sphingomonas sanxanigenens]
MMTKLRVKRVYGKVEVRAGFQGVGAIQQLQRFSHQRSRSRKNDDGVRPIVSAHRMFRSLTDFRDTRGAGDSVTGRSRRLKLEGVAASSENNADQALFAASRATCERSRSCAFSGTLQ